MVDEIFGDPSVECGYVAAPADWEDDASPTILIATYLVPSLADSPSADPVVYLEGGPG